MCPKAFPLTPLYYSLTPPRRDKAEWMRHSQAMSGPAMMFANVKDAQPDGTPYDKKALLELSIEWQNLVKTAGLDAKVYDISNPEATPTKKPKPGAPKVSRAPPPPPRLLISMNTGWRGYELRDFVLRRPQLESLEWDSVKFLPSDLDANGNFKGGVLAKDGMPVPAGINGPDSEDDGSGIPANLRAQMKLKTAEMKAKEETARENAASNNDDADDDL